MLVPLVPVGPRVATANLYLVIAWFFYLHVNIAKQYHHFVFLLLDQYTTDVVSMSRQIVHGYLSLILDIYLSKGSGPSARFRWSQCRFYCVNRSELATENFCLQ